MKELNLDQTWEQCLKMWKWVSEQVGAVSDLRVSALKGRWIEKNDPERVLDLSNDGDCYFCLYTDNGSCVECPAQLVEKSFHCCDECHYYATKPVAFYAELKRLNKIRLERKSK
jgi:hypothetical protein